MYLLSLDEQRTENFFFVRSFCVLFAAKKDSHFAAK
jgi:hypothetical protein